MRICAVDDVPIGEGKAITVAGRRLAVFRSESGWYALDAQCPHLGGPLADGIVAERTVICPLHEKRFDLASGREQGRTGGLCVVTHPLEVRADGVYLVAGELAAAA
jgi:nitrite reductase (NADH) small subunit